MRSSSRVGQFLMVGALCVLALALNHFLLHQVLFSDTLFRRFLFGSE